MTPSLLVNSLSGVRFSLGDEKLLQGAIAGRLTKIHIPFIREYKLDGRNIVDFFWEGTALEIKIKGSPRAIYSQCQRYCDFPQVKALVIATNRSMGFPADINGKPCYIINLGKAWL